MPTKIYIVRHGQDLDNHHGILNGHRDQPLTELGRAQAKATARKLLDKNVQVIYSSPLKRAHQTAEIIAQTLKLKPVIIEPDLIERDFGVLTGKPYSDIPIHSSKTIQTDQVLYFLNAKDCETFPQLLKRSKKILAKLQHQSPDQTIVIVTHGDTGKMIRAAYHHWSWQDGINTPYFANTEILELGQSDKTE